jgi:hypothetical protein
LQVVRRKLLPTYMAAKALSTSHPGRQMGAMLRLLAIANWAVKNIKHFDDTLFIARLSFLMNPQPN